MLVLSRRPGEAIRIGDDILVSVIQVKGDRITLGIEAPRDVQVLRCELVEEVAEQNKVASRLPAAAVESFLRVLNAERMGYAAPGNDQDG